MFCMLATGTTQLQKTQGPINFVNVSVRNKADMSIMLKVTEKAERETETGKAAIGKAATRRGTERVTGREERGQIAEIEMAAVHLPP